MTMTATLTSPQFRDWQGFCNLQGLWVGVSWSPGIVVGVENFVPMKNPYSTQVGGYEVGTRATRFPKKL
jgi:hypothetical protein